MHCAGLGDSGPAPKQFPARPDLLRRRHGLLNGRRPRFLTRRKTGRLAELPVIIGGDRMTD